MRRQHTKIKENAALGRHVVTRKCDAVWWPCGTSYLEARPVSRTSRPSPTERGENILSIRETNKHAAVSRTGREYVDQNGSIQVKPHVLTTTASPSPVLVCPSPSRSRINVQIAVPFLTSNWRHPAWTHHPAIPIPSLRFGPPPTDLRVAHHAVYHCKTTSMPPYWSHFQSRYGATCPPTLRYTSFQQWLKTFRMQSHP